jgi:hypothetical protein
MTEMTEWISFKNPQHASLIDNLRTPPYLSLIVPILPDEFTLQLLKKCHISARRPHGRIAHQRASVQGASVMAAAKVRIDR